MAYRIVTPWSAVNTPFDASSFKRFKHMHWIPSPSKGKATEIDIIITSATTPVSDWPGKRFMKTNLVDSIKLDNSETVWIVYWEVEMPKFPSVQIHPHYYKGKSEEDLKEKNLRILVFGNEKDGSRVLYDCAVVEISNKNK